MRLTSDFGLISIKRDRAKLAKHFEPKPNSGPCPEHLKIPVLIHGNLTGVWGKDDGVDQEFTIDVTRLEYWLSDQPLEATQEVADYIEGTVGIVEATRYEQQVLYEQHKGTWLSTNEGWGPCIGHVGRLPVHISLSTAIVNGRKILFYEPTSRIVDHDLIRAWLTRNVGAVRCTDANNLHLVLQA